MPASSTTGKGQGSVPRCANCRNISHLVDVFYQYFVILSENLRIRVDAELSGDINSVNDTFTLGVEGSNLYVFKNGLMQNEGDDYHLTDNVVVFAISNIPQLGDKIVATVNINMFDSLGIVLDPQ